MKASELKPGKFFEFEPTKERRLCIAQLDDGRCMFVVKRARNPDRQVIYCIDSCCQSLEVNVNVPQCWDDEPPRNDEFPWIKVEPQSDSEWKPGIDDLVADQALWSQATFGDDCDRGPMGALKHLEKEARECQQAPNDIEEYADCLLLLLDATRRAGWAFEQLVDAGVAKKNKQRSWPKPTSDEPVEHVKQPAPLQLRGGGYYRRRDGKVVGPLAVNHGEYAGSHPFRFGYHTFRENGAWMQQLGQDYDLIAEVPPPVKAPSPEFQSECLAAMKRGSDRVLKGKHPDGCDFGQEVCLNCGWDKGGDLPKSLVDFDANGDAVCPECGHNACYFDSRDEVPPPEPKRYDAEGRDVTGLNGLHDETDTVVEPPKSHFHVIRVLSDEGNVENRYTVVSDHPIDKRILQIAGLILDGGASPELILDELPTAEMFVATDSEFIEDWVTEIVGQSKPFGTFMTPEEADAEYENAPAIPISDEEIERLVKNTVSRSPEHKPFKAGDLVVPDSVVSQSKCGFSPLPLYSVSMPMVYVDELRSFHCSHFRHANADEIAAYRKAQEDYIDKQAIEAAKAEGIYYPLEDVEKELAQPDADGWIEWTGGEWKGTFEGSYDLRFRNGREYFNQAINNVLMWHHSGSDVDITHYRLVEPRKYKTAILNPARMR